MSVLNRICGTVLGAFLAFGTTPARATDFTVYASSIGDYMIRIGPSLQSSTGLMLEIASSAFRLAGLSVRMAPEMPWARAQAEAKDKPGAILVVLSRTLQRESQWQWLAPVYTDKTYAFTLAGRPEYSSFEDIQVRRPRVSTKLGGGSESVLKGMGVAVDSSPDMERNFMKLLSGRVDVLLLQGMEIKPAIQSMLASRYRDEFRPKVADLRRTAIMDTPLWMVTSRKTPEADVQKLRNALERFKKTAEYRDLVRRYEARLTESGY